MSRQFPDFSAEDIRTFLRSVDRHLQSPAKLIIIGGGAVAFYDAKSTTDDVDTYTGISAELALAIDDANRETGLNIPVSQPGVADFPYHFEDRLERQLPDLKKLEVWVLEKHDLALSKTVRGERPDEQQLKGVHQTVGLDFETLVQRFRDEMDHVIGDPDRIKLQFLELVGVLFGELKRVAAERVLEKKGGAGQS